jgi:hypothetical protein
MQFEHHAKFQDIAEQVDTAGKLKRASRCNIMPKIRIAKVQVRLYRTIIITWFLWLRNVTSAWKMENIALGVVLMRTVSNSISLSAVCCKI